MTSRSQRMCWVVFVIACASSIALVAFAQKRAPAGRKSRPAAAAPMLDPAPSPVPEPERPAEPSASAAPDVSASAPSADPGGSSVPAPASAPSSAEPAQAPAQTAEDDAELAALRQELAQVMDDLVQARARVALLGKSLFKTSVRVRVDNRAAPDQVAGKVGLWLDGAPIWSGEGSGLRAASQVLFEGGAAPGPHVLSVEIEQRARGDDAYRYTLHDSFHFTLLRERRTDLELVLDDDSDIADEFVDDQEGEYDVRTRLHVRAAALDEE
jgi:hypothetical protein